MIFRYCYFWLKSSARNVFLIYIILFNLHIHISRHQNNGSWIRTGSRYFYPVAWRSGEKRHRRKIRPFQPGDERSMMIRLFTAQSKPFFFFNLTFITFIKLRYICGCYRAYENWVFLSVYLLSVQNKFSLATSNTSRLFPRSLTLVLLEMSIFLGLRLKSL